MRTVSKRKTLANGPPRGKGEKQDVRMGISVGERWREEGKKSFSRWLINNELANLS